MNDLTIDNLTIKFQEFVVLQNFSARFSQGIHWIQGINGSGKSSLLKSLCGIIPVPVDTVKINGYDLVTQANQAKSVLCYVADKPEVYPFMTGIQFLRLIAQIKSTELSEKVYRFMDTINLSQFHNTPFAQMSFGTRRKYTLCSVLIGDPQLILLDEPFNGLDKNTTTHFKDWLVKSQYEKCIVMVSHDSHIIEDIHDSTMQLDEF